MIALGTGMPNVITGSQKASCWYVELGNGEKFLFDLGSGSMENLAKLRPDWSKIDKVFASHLHSDHVLYGAVPVPSGAGLPLGTVGHMQLEWNLPGAGVPLLDSSRDDPTVPSGREVALSRARGQGRVP